MNNSEVERAKAEDREKRAKRFASRNGKTLWHYTDASAIDGILNNKELWFGSMANMNDKKEVCGFIDDLKSVVQNALGVEYHSKIEDVFEKIERKMHNEGLYALCLSKAEDDAAQWERYADAGKGMAVVFNTTEIYKVVSSCWMLFNEVYYTINTEKHKIKEPLVRYIKEGNTDGFDSLDDLIYNLLLCASVHKHKSFSAEQEIRITPTIIRPENEKYVVNDFFRRIYFLKLKEACNKANVEFEDLFDSIVIGPKSRQNIDDLRWYLKKIELEALVVKVRRSECPLK